MAVVTPGTGVIIRTSEDGEMGEMKEMGRWGDGGDGEDEKQVQDHLRLVRLTLLDWEKECFADLENLQFVQMYL
ncbi:hypothetical protein F7734_05610 [Scytonema sp. UIC 10036]|uniref:hypothetical protein n=1 Tax=Scytonema sp. UIC 10036 TaxID=2304196 RepID=UPI0012DACDD6|nr:hypothetical protein [Scytonema sp. UIC 10036]MUG91962.1 hypothetical protein [Scytonema sp. UIC 10036]